MLLEQIVEVVEQLVAGGVADDHRRIALVHLRGHRLKQMGLADAAGTVEVERIVDARLLCGGFGGGGLQRNGKMR